MIHKKPLFPIHKGGVRWALLLPTDSGKSDPRCNHIVNVVTIKKLQPFYLWLLLCFFLRLRDLDVEGGVRGMLKCS